MPPLVEEAFWRAAGWWLNVEAVGHCSVEPCSLLLDTLEKMDRKKGRIVCGRLPRDLGGRHYHLL